MAAPGQYQRQVWGHPIFQAISNFDATALATIVRDDPKALAASDRFHLRPIHLAVLLSNAEALAALVAAQADLDLEITTDLTNNPLILEGLSPAAARRFDTPLDLACKVDNLEGLQLLLDAGAKRTTKAVTTLSRLPAPPARLLPPLLAAGADPAPALGCKASVLVGGEEPVKAAMRAALRAALLDAVLDKYP
jgi:hypothetical protein